MSEKKKIIIAAIKEYLEKAKFTEVEKLMNPDFCLNIYRNSVNKTYRNEKGDVLTILKEVNLPLDQEQIKTNLLDAKNNVCRYYKKTEDIFRYNGKTYLLTNNLYPYPESDLENLISYISTVVGEPLITQLKAIITESGNIEQSKKSAKITEDKKSFNISTTLFYSIQIIKSLSKYTYRYNSSLLAKPFVILTGNSGTGKTRIATQFADWLKVETSSGLTNQLVVPVGADWTDNTKLLGYFNPLADNGKGDYVKTDTLSFIQLANENPQIPFFLILDEMNLSHVERYFADFLSAMESHRPILLYKKPEGCECDVPEQINLPDNLFVTGTVNIDETTYMFSPKVLDRANVIEFTPEKDDVFKIFREKPTSQNIEPAPAGMAEGFMDLALKVRNFENGLITDDGANLTGYFERIYDILKPSGFEFAYRTTKEIVLYFCASRSLNPDVNISEIIDEQIVQKILPKIHGNKKQIGDLLIQLKSFCEKHSELQLSKEKVNSMITKLEKYQYASFI